MMQKAHKHLTTIFRQRIWFIHTPESTEKETNL